MINIIILFVLTKVCQMTLGLAIIREALLTEKKFERFWKEGT